MRPQTVARETEFLFSKNTILKSGHGAPLAGDSELKETERVYFQVTRHTAIGLPNQAHTQSQAPRPAGLDFMTLMR